MNETRLLTSEALGNDTIIQRSQTVCENIFYGFVLSHMRLGGDTEVQVFLFQDLVRDKRGLIK